MVLEMFTDPVLRAPTIGSMLMCLASSLVGVIAFLKRRSLVGEALAHATYPGIILGALVLSLVSTSDLVSVMSLCGAFAFALLGFIAVHVLEKNWKVKSDSALTLVLSLFFGVGVVIASRLQRTAPLLYQKAQTFLYGQTATMTDSSIVVYGLLATVVIGFLVAVYRHLEATILEPGFATSLGIRTRLVDRLAWILLVLAIVIGIRSVGVVLMAGMLICPAAAARPLTSSLKGLFCVAGFFGLLSGFLGNVFALKIPSGQYSLPTGPTILLSAATICLLSLLFAPKTGLIPRHVRARQFRQTCLLENGLKAIWLKRPLSSPGLQRKLWKKGWVDAKGHLTPNGARAAERIVRLHRLWEVYLVDSLGQKVDKVHRNAEELEHLFTPELEIELTSLLNDPARDPHHQPIPRRS
jgi:manganese/zinc/iron transport system permease protein